MRCVVNLSRFLFCLAICQVSYFSLDTFAFAQSDESILILESGSELVGTYSGCTLCGSIFSTYSSGTISSANSTLRSTTVINTTTLDAGETLAPGNSIGTEYVSGNYVQNPGSTLKIEVNRYGSCDYVYISGTATLNGGTVEVLPEDDLYSDDYTYTFLRANNGVTGEFDSVTSNLLFFDTTLIYNSTTVQLQVERNYAKFAQTPNQRAVGNYLSDATDFSLDYGLNLLTTPLQAREALDSLSGEIYGSLSTVGIENTSHFLQFLASRLRSRSLGQRVTYAIPRVQKARSAGEAVVVIRGQETLGWTSRNFGNTVPWGGGYGVSAQMASDGNAGGLDYATGGTAFGLERNLDEYTLIGAVGGYSQTSVHFDRQDDWSTINSAQVGVYLQHDNGDGYATGIAAYGYNDYDTRRHIMPDSLFYESQKEYNGNEFSFYVETGRNFYLRFADLQPFFALQYIQLHQNQIHERDALATNLWIRGINADSFRSLLGLRMVRDVQLPYDHLLSFEARALWRHEFLDEARLVDARFAKYPGDTFTVQGLNVDRDVAILGGGLTFCLRTGAEIYANYDLLISQNYTAHAGTGGLMLVW